MSGYKRVNYYELCRLCTSTEGMKVHIYKEEGRRRQLPTKIKRCLPLKVHEYDLLPKMVCDACIEKLEEIDNFRQLCLEAEKMLQDFRSKLKPSDNGADGKLQVYVKDSQPLISQKMNANSNESANRPSQVQRVFNNNDSEKRMVTQVTTVPSTIPDESRHLPLHCAVPLKLNGVASSVVPVNVENISSLMQVVPDTEMPRIQQFKLPIQTEMAVISEPNNGRFSVTLPATDSVQKDAANVIQQLQCTVAENGSIDVNKLAIQSTVAQSAVSYNSSVVSLITSPPTNVVQNGNVQDVVTQVSIPEDNSNQIKSCAHCNKILNGPNDICNHTVVRPATSTVPAVSEQQYSNSVIQTTVSKFSAKATKRLYSEQNHGFKCDICQKPFRKKEHLFQHRKLHSGDRPYVCGSCGKSFSRKEHLFRHTLSHTGEKRHLCNLCGKTFSRKDNLHKHRKIHGITGPYECELCGKSFIVQHYFLMHQANHTADDMEDLPFQCDICKKGFLKEEFLKRHKVRHRVRNVQQVEDNNDLSTINSVAILSPNVVQQSTCTDETVYMSTQPATFTLTTSVASNTTTATQTPLFSTDLAADGQLLDNYQHLSSTVVSS